MAVTIQGTGLQVYTLTQIVHILYPHLCINPLLTWYVLGLPCSISLQSSQIIKRKLMLSVHYTKTKWNRNKNLPLTVTHDCAIPLPPVHRRLSNQSTTGIVAFSTSFFLFPVSPHESLTNQLVTAYFLFRFFMPCTFECYRFLY